MNKFEELKAEAIKRGVWNNPNTTQLDGFCRDNATYIEIYNEYSDRLWDSYGIIYEQGIWIEPLQTSTKPTHYQTQTEFDVIDFCKAYDLNFNLGCIVKYLARAGKKGDRMEDLKKALDYLQREIKYYEQNK
jgi:hypothetical protein